MKYQDELMEKYEDAMFAILMDRVAQAEGAWAIQENERLKQDPSAAVPKEVDERCLRAIKRGFVRKQRRVSMDTVGKILQRVSVAVIVLIASATVAFAAFPELRANVFNTILNVYDTYTDFSFEETNQSSVLPELEIKVGWLPEGFGLIEDDSISSCAWKYYEDGAGKNIEINKSFPTTIGADTEDAVVTPVSVHNYEATLIEKNGEVTIIWLDIEEQVVYLVNTEGLDVDTVFKVAENVS